MTKLVLTILIIVVALFILNRSNRWKERRTRGVLYPPPGEGTDADVERLIAAGRKITAIKLYREIHHVGLKEAKHAVEEMARRGTGR